MFVFVEIALKFLLVLFAVTGWFFLLIWSAMKIGERRDRRNKFVKCPYCHMEIRLDDR